MLDHVWPGSPLRLFGWKTPKLSGCCSIQRPERRPGRGGRPYSDNGLDAGKNPTNGGVIRVVAGPQQEAGVQHLEGGDFGGPEQLPARALARGALGGEPVAAQQLSAVA